VPVTVEAEEVGRFGQDTEAAVYFCCLEALQNTAKYASAPQARICLQAQGGTLRFTVSDDGTGYDASHTPMGSGLRNMADRLAALGGRLEVQSAPGQGTTITGHLPIPATSGNHQHREVADGLDGTKTPANSQRESATGNPQTLIARPGFKAHRDA
jgi:signal transduction histidine kinase